MSNGKNMEEGGSTVWVRWRGALSAARSTGRYWILGLFISILIIVVCCLSIIGWNWSALLLPIPIWILVVTWRKLGVKVAAVRNRVLTGQCVYCGGTMTTEQVWLCGFCGKKNSNTDRWHFLDKCEHCGFPPKAMECIHCDGIIFLDPDMDNSHFAYAPDSARPKPRQERDDGEHQLELRKVRNRVELRTEQAREAKAELLQQTWERRRNLDKEKDLPHFDRIAKEIEKDITSHMGIESIFRKHEVEISKITDPEERKRWQDVIRYLRIKYMDQ